MSLSNGRRSDNGKDGNKSQSLENSEQNEKLVSDESLKRITSSSADCVIDLINLKNRFPVEIFENERYSPFSNNWSGSNLLPSDRYNYTTKDGNEGFSSLADVEKAFLSKGWGFEDGSKWKVEVIQSRTDQQGLRRYLIVIYL